VKTVKEHLKKFILIHKKDWGDRLCIFLLAYHAPTNKITGTTPTSMLFKRQLCLPCDLLFRAPPDKSNYMADLADQMYEIHHYTCQHLKVASNRMKIHYDHLANSAGLHEDDHVLFYCQTGSGKVT
jgi:hypothetical protein